VKSKTNQNNLNVILGNLPNDAVIQKLKTILPGVEKIESQMYDKVLVISIVYLVQTAYFVDNGGGKIVILGDGTTVDDAQVHRDIDEINMKSPLVDDKPAITVRSIKNGVFEITDRLIRTKAERAEQRALSKASFKQVTTFAHPGIREVPNYRGNRNPSMYDAAKMARPFFKETPIKEDMLPTSLSNIFDTPFTPRGRGVRTRGPGGRGGRGGGGRGGGGISGLGTSSDPYSLATPQAPDLDETQDYEPPE
jgi:uncharacterized membrane protein YgcG